MLRTLFGRIFLWSTVAQLVTLGSALALTALYLPEPEAAIDNAYALYADTAVALYEKFGPAALDAFLARTGEDTLLQLHFASHRPDGRCEPGTVERDGGATATIAAKGMDGDYCLTVHAKAGALPESPAAYRERLQIILLFELLGCAGGSYLVARYLSRPIALLRQAAARLARGDLTARVGRRYSRRRDEAADLVREFDHMAERIAALVEAQRRLIGDISHEIKSPLARLSVALGLAERAAGAHAPRQFERMQREIESIAQLSRELLTLASLDADARRADPEPVDLAAMVDAVVADARFESASRAGDLRVHRPAEPVLVMGDPDLLRRAVENVLRNAIFYTPDGTPVDVQLARRGDGWALIEVSDGGPGVPETAIARLFEPFYRVDEARGRQTGGSGIGLAICQRAVRLHHGFVRARNAVPHGLVVEIGLPLGQAAPA